jgi:hypothetical protein
VGFQPLVEKLWVGEGVSAVRVDGVDDRFAGGQVVGMACIDDVPAPFGRLVMSLTPTVAPAAVCSLRLTLAISGRGRVRSLPPASPSVAMQ